MADNSDVGSDTHERGKISDARAKLDTDPHEQPGAAELAAKMHRKITEEVKPTWPAANPTEGSKWCFVTVGATASFTELLVAVLKPSLLDALKKHGFTNLLVQYGLDGKIVFDAELKGLEALPEGLEIQSYEFKPSIADDIRLAKAEKGRKEGVLITHGGSGTILDAVRMNIPTIVVPNSALLDNHQVELAEALSKLGWVVHGDLENLEKSLEAVEKLSQKRNALPQEELPASAVRGGFPHIIEREVGFLVD